MAERACNLRLYQTLANATALEGFEGVGLNERGMAVQRPARSRIGLVVANYARSGHDVIQRRLHPSTALRSKIAIRQILHVLLFIFMWTWADIAMADGVRSGGMNRGAFSLSWSGGLEYGSREINFDGEETLYFANGDTINDETQTGVGVFALSLQRSDVQALKNVAQALCDPDVQTGGPETYDPAATFSVVCLNDGKAVRRSGSLRLIPERFRHQVFDVPLRLSEQARTDGRKLIKLDFSALSVERKDGRYLVSVRFINSGTRWIRFSTPDQWEGTITGGRLGVGAVSRNGVNGASDKVQKSWAFGLSGRRLINREDFPQGIVTLNPGDIKILKFESTPDYSAVKGDYEFSGIAFMRIEYDGYGWGLSSQVDFKPIRRPVTVDEDYPSTAREREQWEATHRAAMSHQPVKPGQTFAEHGLYRAVRLADNGAYRSLQLVPFKAGDIATTENVKMLMASASGAELNGPVQWLWEGSAPTPVKQWSSETIEDTKQFCKSSEVCPRSGRWLARVRAGSSSNAYRYDLAGIVTMRQGQRMPARNDGAEWEWLGV
ncbi:hypothetical protein [Caballeronia sp. GAWG1-5s-s]|uniref:hypothetical protein n=1 Tax=Caballeronia sp. GAWG1-5s-s TaxID=2921743 RepID=UPI002027B55A|nr:hypothetical protein [Caballeronia sp. GAWG1-5s-s]